MEKKRSGIIMLLVCLSLFAIGCSTVKPAAFREGIDVIPLEAKEALPEDHIRGWFLSDDFYDYQFDRCK
jgi:hypothetical protein